MRTHAGSLALFIFFAAVAVALAGCRSAPEPGRVDSKATVLAVYPMGFRWDEPAYRSFEVTGRLIDQVLRDRKLQTLVYGPGEFQIFRADDDNVFAATTLGSLLPQLHRTPGEVLVLRSWAEKRVLSSSKMLLNAHGKTVGLERDEEVTFVGHVEVLHPATRTRIYERTSERRADPFAERTDDGADPAPELTELMTELVHEAMVDLEDHFAPAGTFAHVPGVSLDVTPLFAFGYSEPGRPSYDAQLARLGPLDRELFVTSRARFRNPQLPVEAAAKLGKLPGGLHVHEAPKGALLQPGDLILEVNGQPAHPQTLVRARLLPGEDHLKVRRASGDYQALALP